MKLEKLYEMQKALDAKIIKEKGLEGRDLLPNTVLALQVEIAELANEWRGFKHWSKRQIPAPPVFKMKPSTDGHSLEWEPGDGYESYPLLEEYVDCLHFFLSIARQLELPAGDFYVPDEELEDDTVRVFIELQNEVGMIAMNEDANYRLFCYQSALSIFLQLGTKRLGFTSEQIVAAYMEKNRLNHERQANGY